MQNSLIKKKNGKTQYERYRQKDKNQNIKIEGENNKDCLVSVKAFQSKFIAYLNQLNSSIQNCKKKTHKKYGYSDDKIRSQCSEVNSQESVDQHGSRSSRRSIKNIQKRRSFAKQYQIIEGTKINGKIHGKAILQLNNGSIFKGLVQQGQIKDGQLVFADGSQYEGGFKNSLFHGTGKLKLANGIQYKANFINGSMQKTGEIIYDNGDIYKGEILNYKKHGYGQLFFKNGNRYVGNFIQGEITGFGVYYINQFPIAKGMWLKGQFLDKSNSLNNSLSDEVMQSSAKS